MSLNAYDPVSSPIQPGSFTPSFDLSPNGYRIFIDRYALKDPNRESLKVGNIVVFSPDNNGGREIGEVIGIEGNVVSIRAGEAHFEKPISEVDLPLETKPVETIQRVAKAIASIEEKDEREYWENAFTFLMSDGKFLPGGRILAGAGSDALSYYNCYVLPCPHDSRQGIISQLEQMIEIMSRGGGVGFSLSSLRPRYAYVKGVNGRSSGSVSWGEIYSFATGLIEQGGSRRGALMLTLDVWHPDILEFINVKRDMKRITNANISVMLTDDFMDAVKADDSFDLVFPDTEHPAYESEWDGDLAKWKESYPVKVYQTVRARDIWMQIIESAWASAEPGLLFIDRINNESNSHYYARLVSVNPCLTADSWIHTSDGPKQISDLQDTPFTAVIEGKEYSSSELGFWSNGIKVINEIKTKEGYSLRTTPDHRMLCIRNGQEEWVEAQDLKAGDKMVLSNQRDAKTWTGDGGSFEEGHLFGLSSFSENVNFITPSVERKSYSFYRGFLCGLFDSKSSIQNNPSKDTVINLSEISAESLQAVQRMLLRIGIRSEISQRQELIIEQEDLFMFNECVGFQHPEKKQSLMSALSKKSLMSALSLNKRKPYKTKFSVEVQSVEPCGEEEVFDATIDVLHRFDANGLIAHNCGEEPLPGYGVCNLGALNLSKFAALDQHGYPTINWGALRICTHLAVRLLDNIIDKQVYFLNENEARQKGERRVGLGTMGLADLLIKLKVRYGSEESIALIDSIFEFIKVESYRASIELAKEHGAFPDFDVALLDSDFAKRLPEEIREGINEYGLRNVTLLTSQPTGTTGTMMDTSTGMEPFFFWEYVRNSRVGTMDVMVEPYREWIEEHGKEAELPDYFVTAMDLPPEEHVTILAAIQKHTDAAISKTCNLPSDYTIEDTADIYMKMYDLGCKGGTIYRDKSRDIQILNLKEEEEEKEDAPIHVDMDSSEFDFGSLSDDSLRTMFNAMQEEWSRRNPPSSTALSAVTQVPNIRAGMTMSVDAPGGKAHITLNHTGDHQPIEVFVDIGKAGTSVKAFAEALGRVMSLYLRNGAPRSATDRLHLLVDQLRGIGGSHPIGFGKNRVLSLPDAVGATLDTLMQVLQQRQDELTIINSVADMESPEQINVEKEERAEKKPTFDLCPSCGSMSYVHGEGCGYCVECGFSKC